MQCEEQLGVIPLKKPNKTNTNQPHPPPQRRTIEKKQQGGCAWVFPSPQPFPGKANLSVLSNSCPNLRAAAAGSGAGGRSLGARSQRRLHPAEATGRRGAGVRLPGCALPCPPRRSLVRPRRRTPVGPCSPAGSHLGSARRPVPPLPRVRRQGDLGPHFAASGR